MPRPPRPKAPLHVSARSAAPRLPRHVLTLCGLAGAGALWLLGGCASPAATGPQTPAAPAPAAAVNGPTAAVPPAAEPPAAAPTAVDPPAAEPAGGAPPGASWARAIGGNNRDFGAAVAVAGDGRVFVGGHFTGGTTDTRGRTVVSRGASDAWLAELAPDGSLVAMRIFGGSGADEIKALAAGNAGELYVAGLFTDRVDFDPGPGRANLVATGSADAFVLRLEADGSLGWARAVGGAFGDVALGLAARPGGGVLVAGYFQGTADLDPGEGQAIFASAGRTDAFALALDGAGELVWASAFGGEGDDEATSIGPLGAEAGAGAIVAGQFAETAGFTGHDTPAALVSAGGSDAFAAGIDGGGQPRWAIRLGGAGKDGATALAPLPGGGAIVVGQFLGEASAESGQTITSSGRNDVFLLTLAGDGQVSGLRQLGEPGDDFSFGVTAGAAAVYVAVVSQALSDPAANRGPGTTGSAIVRLASSPAGTPAAVEIGRWRLTATGGIQILDLALAADGAPVAAGTFQGEATLEIGTTGALTPAGKTDAFAAVFSPSPPQ